jgi:hypothetical protein
VADQSKEDYSLKQITKRDVASAKQAAEIRSLERKGTIAAWNDYIGFGVSKTLGVIGLFVGGLEYLDPTILPIMLNNPGWVAGAGLALLTGRSLMSLLTKLDKESPK